MSGRGVERRTVLKAGLLATVPAVLARAENAPPPPPKPGAATFARPPLGVMVLARLGFGVSEADLSAFKQGGRDDNVRLSAWLEAQLRPAELDDGACEQRLKALGSLGQSVPDLWKTYYRGAPQGERRYEVLWQPTLETRLAVLTRMVYSRRQLHEVVTGFWRDHFNVHPDKDERIPALLPHYDATLRTHALGNFRTLLGAVARHPVMLYYLDNASSTRSGPNENYARELFELHTLGAGHYRGVGRQSAVPRAGGLPGGYVDDDVYEATRVLTGWRTADDPDSALGDSGDFTFDPQGHDRFQKTVLGHYFPPNGGVQEGEVLLDRLAAHPGTARHVALKLARRLITDSPPPELVEGAAQVFLKTLKAPDQLAQVVRFLAGSDAFRTSWGERLRRPLDGLAAAMRALGSDLQARPGEFWPPGWLGQEVYDWRPPNGAPDLRTAWSGSGHLLRRWTMARALGGNWWKEVRSDVPGITPEGLRTPLELADHWATRVLGQPLPAASREVVARQLAAGADLNAPLTPQQIAERLPDAVAFVLMTPEFLVG